MPRRPKPPSQTWTAQQTVEAFPDGSAPRYLLRDRDGIYGDEVPPAHERQVRAASPRAG